MEPTNRHEIDREEIRKNFKNMSLNDKELFIDNRLGVLQDNFVRCIPGFKFIPINYKELEETYNIFREHQDLIGSRVGLVEMMDAIIQTHLSYCYTDKSFNEETSESLEMMTSMGITDEYYFPDFIETLKEIYPEMETIENEDDFTREFGKILVNKLEDSYIKVFLTESLIESL